MKGFQQLVDVAENAIKVSQLCAEATVIARGYITILDLRSALNNCGLLEFERKRKLKQAIASVQLIIDDYQKKAPRQP